MMDSRLSCVVETDTHQVKGFVGISLISGAVTADGGDVQHASSEFNKCSSVILYKQGMCHLYIGLEPLNWNVEVCNIA